MTGKPNLRKVATVNGWDAEVKLNWIKAFLAGRAQKAFQSLFETA